MRLRIRIAVRPLPSEHHAAYCLDLKICPYGHRGKSGVSTDRVLVRPGHPGGHDGWRLHRRFRHWSDARDAAANEEISQGRHPAPSKHIHEAPGHVPPREGVREQLAAFDRSGKRSRIAARLQGTLRRNTDQHRPTRFRMPCHAVRSANAWLCDQICAHACAQSCPH